MASRVDRLTCAAFMAWGVLPTFLAVGGIAHGPIRLWQLLLAAFALTWLAVAALLWRGDRHAIAAALALIAIPWSAALVQTVRRVAFVVREGGLESANGHGSPLAFLIGFAGEQVLAFIPLTVLAALLVRATRRGRSRSLPSSASIATYAFAILLPLLDGRGPSTARTQSAQESGAIRPIGVARVCRA